MECKFGNGFGLVKSGIKGWVKMKLVRNKADLGIESSPGDL